MTLAWLEFDYSEDAEGNGSFDAMAAASPAQLQDLQGEIAQVLDWAHAHFGEPMPPDEGGEWHYELQGVQEVATPLRVAHSRGRLQVEAGAAGTPRVTLSLTVGGTPGFCAALRQEFGLA
ncbi:hypothetical protein LZ009_01860 [Ramlibacter sp. XY19]|uniref:hypothetical protein n=1 Tax=Ramlibacter paludis TaxID=2908000 RepID=UPI0023DC5381|nr:hypothetical protein [Ramlibacter paludis]MCG2591526.1 hypothetical protein [Ramlibacter paludis]